MKARPVQRIADLYRARRDRFAVAREFATRILPAAMRR